MSGSKVLVLAQRTWSVPDASTDAVQAARAHEKALGAARLEAKEAREAHGALEKECAAKDEIERVTSAAAEHDPATAAELQLRRILVQHNPAKLKNVGALLLRYQGTRQSCCKGVTHGSPPPLPPTGGSGGGSGGSVAARSRASGAHGKR